MDEWYTLDDISLTETSEKLYCIAVDSPEKQFLAGRIGFPTHNTDQGKSDDELKGEASMIIGSIARLGRAAGVHLVIATQRPDAKILPGEVKANLGVRINCGRTDSNASSMILGTSDGVRVKSNPVGRLYLRIFGNGDHGQGFFASQDWIDEYLASQGLNPDGSPLSKKRSRLASVADISSFEGTTLDEREGHDNSAIIERIRAEEAAGNFGEDSELNDIDSDEETSDDGWGFDEDFEEASENSPADEKLGRPELTNKTDANQWHRPEDDWDNELESLIEENFD